MALYSSHEDDETTLMLHNVMSPLDNSSDASSEASLRENEIILGTSGITDPELLAE